jgi:hypothetical protein
MPKFIRYYYGGVRTHHHHGWVVTKPRDGTCVLSIVFTPKIRSPVEEENRGRPAGPRISDPTLIHGSAAAPRSTHDLSNVEKLVR